MVVMVVGAGLAENGCMAEDTIAIIGAIGCIILYDMVLDDVVGITESITCDPRFSKAPLAAAAKLPGESDNPVADLESSTMLGPPTIAGPTTLLNHVEAAFHGSPTPAAMLAAAGEENHVFFRISKHS